MSKTNGVHEYAKTKSELNFELKLNGRNAKIGVSLKKNLFSSWIEALQSVCENLRGTTGPYAAINVNPVGGGGECEQGVKIWQILKFFDQIPQGGKRKVNQKCQKSPHPRGKNLNKQYYNTV